MAGALVDATATDVQNCESNHRRLKQYRRAHHHSVSIKQTMMSVCFSGWYNHRD